MTVWTVYVNGEADFASDKYSEAASRASFLIGLGYDVAVVGQNK